MMMKIIMYDNDIAIRSHLLLKMCSGGLDCLCCKPFFLRMPTFPTYAQCSCGRYYWCASAEMCRKTFYRCEQGHVDQGALVLAKGTITPRTSLFAILTHGGTTQQNQCDKLKRQLLDYGVPAKNIMVIFGFDKDRYDYRGRELSKNECTHYSVRFEWLPRVAWFLQEHPHQVRAVFYLECSAKCEFTSMSDLCATSYQIAWLGFRKVHAPNFFANHHDKVVVEGSKCIRFSEGGLVRLWQVLCAQRTFSHFDLMLCRHLPNSAFWRPAQSLFGTRAHMSVPGGGKRRAATPAEDTYVAKRNRYR